VCQYLLQSYFSIRKLNNGKAADENGIQAEHFKFANAELATEICSITNQIFEELNSQIFKMYSPGFHNIILVVFNIVYDQCVSIYCRVTSLHS
jgi:hypothetical protein